MKMGHYPGAEDSESDFPPDSGPQHYGGPSDSFNFTTNVDNSVSVSGNNNIVNVHHGERLMVQNMRLLWKHIIHGATHDSSARDPPPRCHPGTRIKLIDRITAWFHSDELDELLLWINGFAGVGKSAVAQTFAEYLVKNESHGASVFCSRPNNRNDPNRVFITIAYQLANRIEAYRTFISEKISRDPDILKKDLETQFKIFIIEPFAERKIGAGGKRLGIILDGLDEIDGQGPQCHIIRLISSFTQKHYDTPLLWVIASRPETHIGNAFNSVKTYRLENIPVDSTEACEDVERFLHSSFDSMREDPQLLVPRDWPDSAAILKLAAAASGLFVFADIAIRFIRDYVDPIEQLDIVLSAIDCSPSVSSEQQPFAHLDSLYTQIISPLIPTKAWPTVKAILRLALAFRDSSFVYKLRDSSVASTLRGMTMILGLDQRKAQVCLSKCRAALDVPPLRYAHERKLTFSHASFADYLVDQSRSGEFYISVDGAEEDILLFYLKSWHKFVSRKPHTSPSNLWATSDPSYGDEMQQVSSKTIKRFNTRVFGDMVKTLASQMIERHKSQPTSSSSLQPKQLEVLNSLQRVNVNDLFRVMDENSTPYFADQVLSAWKNFGKQLQQSGVLHQVYLRNLTFEHLDLQEMSPANTRLELVGPEHLNPLPHREPNGRIFPYATSGSSLSSSKRYVHDIEDLDRSKLRKVSAMIIQRPPWSHTWSEYISELLAFQRERSDLPVLIFGTPGGRVALFTRTRRYSEVVGFEEKQYIIPYPK